MTVKVVTIPEGLFTEIFAGLSAQVEFGTEVGTTHFRFTSDGKVEPDGVVVKVSPMLAGIPGVSCTVPGTDSAIVKSTLVIENVAADPVPAIDAVTLYGPPVMPFAVNAGAVATPLASVVTVEDAPPPVKAPLAPFDGAVNLTLTPGTGWPLASVTVASRAAGSGVSTIER